MKMKYRGCLAGFIVLVACGCSPIKKHTSYHKIMDPISGDAVITLKTAIRSVSNELFTPLRYTPDNGGAIGYRMLSPERIETGKRYPLVLVLHSSGTPVGTDNVSQLGVLVKLWAQQSIRSAYPAFVIAPQFPSRTSNYWMDSTRNVLSSVPDPQLMTAIKLIDSLKRALPVDSGMIYVMGFSMGASSAINCVDWRPDLFTAAVAISGIPSFRDTIRGLPVPIWMIHGNADTENPFASDSLFYSEMKVKSKKTRLVRFWEIDGLEHDIYYKLYSTDIIPEWLFRYKKTFRQLTDLR